MLPILHLNGYKIAGPTVLARIPREELEQFLRGYGWAPRFVEGDDPAVVHRAIAAALDDVVADIRRIQPDARANGFKRRPRWPMIVMRTPKGWTGPKQVDGVQVEGTFRAHQVPFDVGRNPEHLAMLEAWLQSYRPEELFDARGRLAPELAELPPKGDRRMGANPHANGGLLRKELEMPDFASYAVDVPEPGATDRRGHARAGAARARRALDERRRAQLPRLQPGRDGVEPLERRLRGRPSRRSVAEILPTDDHVSPDGRVMEMLSEHQCEGWLEGYLLTGRHGFFSCYEAFIHIVDSMFNQHAKWLKVTRAPPLAAAHRVAQLHAHVARVAPGPQRLLHQDPGFIDHVVNKKAEVVRVYLPPDANTLL